MSLVHRSTNPCIPLALYIVASPLENLVTCFNNALGRSWQKAELGITASSHHVSNPHAPVMSALYPQEPCPSAFVAALHYC